MESKRLVILGIMCFQVIFVMAQINVSLEYDCMEKNSLIMAKALMESENEDVVSALLENNINFLFFMNVDSLGHVVNIDKIRSKEEIPEGLKDKVESCLRKNKTSFYLCFDLPETTSKEYMYRLITKDLFKCKDTHLINVAFPGNVMRMYNGKGDCSKYDYLKSYIEEFLFGKKSCLL